MATPIVPPLAGTPTSLPPVSMTPPGAVPTFNTAAPRRPPLDLRADRGIIVEINADGDFGLAVYALSLGSSPTVWELRNLAGEVVSTHVVPDDVETNIAVSSGWGGGTLALVSEPDALDLLRLSQLTNVTAVGVRALQNLKEFEVEYQSQLSLALEHCPRLKNLYAPGNGIGSNLHLQALPALHSVNLVDNVLPPDLMTQVLFLLASTAVGKLGIRTADLSGDNQPPTASGVNWALQLEEAGWSVSLPEESEEGTPDV